MTEAEWVGRLVVRLSSEHSVGEQANDTTASFVDFKCMLIKQVTDVLNLLLMMTFTTIIITVISDIAIYPRSATPSPHQQLPCP